MTATAPAHALARYREQFPIFHHATYLNSCSLGAPSLRTRARLTEYLNLWERRGASAWYDTWLPDLERLRGAYSRVLGADPSEISLHGCVSTALAAVAESLDYRRRPRVVITSLDFPTVAYQWLAKASRGVEVVMVESPDGITVPLDLLAAAIDERTALVATSHVFFTSGAIQDARALVSLARERGALILLDGYQAAGQVEVDARALGVDFYCGGGLKWLLGGSGIAFLYTRRELASSLEPGVSGWFAHAAPFAFDPRRLERPADARRFEQGTPSMAAVYAQLAGLEIIEEIGIPAIARVTRALAEELIAEASDRGFRPHVAADPEARSAIVMLPRQDAAADVRRLAAAGFIVDSRPGSVRVSPYFYNVPTDSRALLEQLNRV